MPKPFEDDGLSRREFLKTIPTTSLAAAPVTAAPPIREDGWVRGKLTGAQTVAAILLAEGCGYVFGIPGAQENELWDAFKQLGVQYLLSTHEFSAACMADGWARSTGKPGVLCVVPGPGLTNSLSGLGEALLDSVPIVCLVGDVANGDHYKPFQVHCLPTVDLLKPVTKAVFAVTHVDEIAGAVRSAFTCAASGEPGPVAVVIPYNLLTVKVHVASPPSAAPAIPFDEPALHRALELLADRNLRVGIYSGQGCMDSGSILSEVAEVLDAPVATSVSGKGVISECHPLAVGWGYGPQGTTTAESIFHHHVDLVLAIGVKFSEVSTGFYSFRQPKRLIHVDANPKNLGRIYKASVCVAADAALFLQSILEQRERLCRPTDGKLRRKIASLKQEEQKTYSRIYAKQGVDPVAFLRRLRCLTAADAMAFIDVTASEHWAAELFTTTLPRTYFNPTDNQSMGWSIPAAIGAQRAFPCRQTVTVTGDGCFLMSAMELSTAAREGLPVKFFILDDGAYYYMQALQKSAYRRTTATILANLDYRCLAQGLGVDYCEILATDQIDEGIQTALACDRPVLTRVVVDYRDRPIRWLDAVRGRFIKELSAGQKARFLARLGTRALDLQPEFND
jgi:acetolactate synthase I/II/III large subunit